jgi:endonuclease/exonuclease/phosphatase family metal-dependent hydrolase
MTRPHLLLSVFAAGALFLACAPEDDAASDPTQAGDPTEASEQDVTAGAGRRVCSWNMRRLGNVFDQRPKDMKSAAKIIKDNCDLIAVEEDMATTTNGTASNTGYDDLLKALGSRYWGGLATSTPAPMPQTSNSEHYAFYFRKSAVSVCENWGPEAKRLPDPEDIYLREPAFGCFKFKSSEHELVLAGYHAIFGEPADRKREVGFIDDDNDQNGEKDDLFNLMKASRPTAPDVVLVGDFNLSSNEIKEVLPRYTDLTTGNGSTLNDQDGISPNQYDHVIVMPDARMITAGTKPAEVLDVRTQHEAGVSFYRSVSDHLPIRFLMK